MNSESMSELVIGLLVLLLPLVDWSLLVLFVFTFDGEGEEHDEYEDEEDDEDEDEEDEVDCGAEDFPIGLLAETWNENSTEKKGNRDHT